jgi:hypothetical protein
MNEALKELAKQAGATVHKAMHGEAISFLENDLERFAELVRQMEIVVRRKTVYGNDVIYPVCDTAVCLTMLGDTKTITQRQIGIIKALGYKIVLEQQEEV